MFLHKHFGNGASTSETDDVVRNLRFVLGTRRGAGYFIPSFGLTDIGGTQEQMIVMRMAEIEENLRLYEPRVELIGMDEIYDDDSGSARLSVKLRLRGTEDRLELVVDLEAGTFDFRPVSKGGPEDVGAW
jgi:phage baseplate assembly protein W